MHTRADRAKEIFLDALDVGPPGDRRAFLDRACGGDAALRGEVEDLLAHHAEVGSFLSDATAGFQKPAERPAGERPGTEIGPYKLLEQIGEGGFGVVYMAEQQRPVRRRVALKVLKPGMDTRQVVARFEAERQALALMDHPNIARVFDGGAMPSGRPYFVMELVKGVPITDFCDQARLSPRERLGLFQHVCHAVQHAHQKGIIHRDLKPSNVLVTVHDATPVAKVIDFGVAKALAQELTDKTLFTGFAQMVGTPLYMSPEQAGQSGLDVDTRTDVYALGVLLYELLTGTTPFDQDRLRAVGLNEVLRIIREEEPARPSARLSTLGPAAATVSANRGSDPRHLSRLIRGELDWIVMKALEKDRNRRYESAAALAADVERYLRDEPVQACPPSAGYRLRKLVRRHRRPVLAASLLLLALVGGIVGTTWGLIRATDARAVAQQSKRDADEQLFESYLDQARAVRLSRHPGQRFDSLAILRQATDLARRLDLPADRLQDVRNGVIASLALPDLHPTGPWHPWPDDAYAVDFDEAHSLYARTDRRGNCSVRRTADDVELYHLTGRGVPATPRLGRDGKFLAVQYHRADRPDLWGGSVQLWALGEPSPRLLLSEEKGFHAVFHPDGRQFGLSYTDGTIRLFGLPDGRPLGNPLPPDTRNSLTREVKIALHPSEPLVAVSSYFRTVVHVRDVRTGKLVTFLPQPAGVTDTAWHPDGQTLAVAHAEPLRTLLFDRTTFQPYRRLEGCGVDIAFNHAGDRLVAHDWGGTTRLFDVATGQKLFAAPGCVSHRFSRDDGRLAGGVHADRLGPCQVGDGREYRTLVQQAEPDSTYSSLSLHPGGRLLAAGMQNGFGLWDLATGCELAFVPVDRANGGVQDLHFEPSGSLLTAGYSGLLRWPVRDDPTAAGRLVIGPPKRLLPRASYISQSRDGRVVVACTRAVGQYETYAGGWILHADRPDEKIRIDAGADTDYIAVSPDGRWVVTVDHNPGLAKVWDARDGRFVKQLAEYGAGYPHFSPDGLWLSTAAAGGRIFAVETWEPGPQVGAAGAFAPDSRLMAVHPTNGAIRLVDRATGRELARLEDPDNKGATRPLFTPDGTGVIDLAGKGICVWDLRLIRERLKPFGLDWEYSDFPPPAVESRSAAPLKVQVITVDLRTPLLTREREVRHAIERYRLELKANPDDPKACNNLAWFYLTGPESLRDVGAAVPLAEKAAGLVPENGVYGNTLGVAYYRAGRYRKAIEVLRNNLEKVENWGLAFDLYFLAMSHHRLGEPAAARVYYDWAVRWARTHKGYSSGHVEELDLFHEEASGVLGVAPGGAETAPSPRVKP